MLPDSQYDPSLVDQPLIGIPITRFVGIYFGQPPLAVGLWDSAVGWAPVPEATIAEHGQSQPGERNIDRSFRSWNGRVMDTEPKTCAMQFRP